MLLVLLLKALVVVVRDEHEVKCVSFVEWTAILVFIV